MTHFRKIWNERTNGYLAEISKLGLSKQEIHQKFLEKFPNSEVTETAIRNQLSRLHLVPPAPHSSTRRRPLYSEQIKKQYVKIKVAQPSTWIQKHRWVWEETHPGEELTDPHKHCFIFLDGNIRNFAPDNIERIDRDLQPYYIQCGGCAKGDPELTKLHIVQAQLKRARFNAGEKIGLVKVYKNNNSTSRVFIDESKERSREYVRRPEIRKRNAEKRKAYLQDLRANHPEKYAELLRKNRERRRKKNDKTGS